MSTDDLDTALIGHIHDQTVSGSNPASIIPHMLPKVDGMNLPKRGYC